MEEKRTRYFMCCLESFLRFS